MGIVAASVAVHAVLLALVAIQSPRLKVPPEPPGLPEAIIPVLIIPRTPPPAAAPPGAQPTPIRLHRRPQPFADEAPIAPLIAPVQPTAPAPKAPSVAGPRPIIGPTPEESLARDARNALRSRLDCDSPLLSRAEREGCRDRFGDRNRGAPFEGLGIERGKDSDLARAARRKEQDWAYKRSGSVGPGTAGSGYNAGQEMRPGAPNMGMGASSQDIGRTTGCDGACTAKQPF